MSIFSNFISTVDSIVRQESDPTAIVSAVAGSMNELILDRTWLGSRYTKPLPHKAYAQYLLHRADAGAFSIVSFVWNPMQGSPIHDHGGTWGVTGQYDGEEEETRYKILPTQKLEVVKTLTILPGDVTSIYPPDRDVHQISNKSNTTAISIHVYGCDIGALVRRKFELTTGQSECFLSGYDLP